MKIAIIAGSGNLPVQIATQNREFFVLCIQGYSCPSSFKNKSETVSLFEPLLWLNILKSNNITHVVMAGKIDRPSDFSKISNKKANSYKKDYCKNYIWQKIHLAIFCSLVRFLQNRIVWLFFQKERNAHNVLDLVSCLLKVLPIAWLHLQGCCKPPHLS